MDAGNGGHDGVDHVAGRVEIEQGEDGGVGLVDDDGCPGRESARPDRVSGCRPRTVTPDSGTDEVERTVGLGGSGGEGDEDPDRGGA